MDSELTTQIFPNPREHAAYIKSLGYDPADWLRGHGVVLRDRLPSEWAKEVFDALVTLYPKSTQFQ